VVEIKPDVMVGVGGKVAGALEEDAQAWVFGACGESGHLQGEALPRGCEQHGPQPAVGSLGECGLVEPLLFLLEVVPVVGGGLTPGGSGAFGDALAAASELELVDGFVGEGVGARALADEVKRGAGSEGGAFEEKGHTAALSGEPESVGR